MIKTDLGCGVMPIAFDGGNVMLLDQRMLPDRVVWFNATELGDMCAAISDMVVRGAPSIGVSAAYGLACEALRQSKINQGANEFLAALDQARNKLNATRPTAVNLRWGTGKVFDFVSERVAGGASLQDAGQEAVGFAGRILDFHVETNEKLSAHGAELLGRDVNVITHCNAGPLAACGWGTALGVIRQAKLSGKKIHVFVDETRPRNQGAQLTMWELQQDKVESTLVCDSMSGHIMATKKIDAVITGADRIAANGDSANKIGTYNLAVVANYHKVPFYIAAPLSTIDSKIETGKEIPIEERDVSELTSFCGRPTTVQGARAYNPAFDVTPQELIAGIITEYGVLKKPYTKTIKEALSSPHKL